MLSNNPQVNIQALLPELLRALSSFGDLLNNPKELHGRIKEAMELSDSEKAKVDAANNYIRQADEAKNDLIRRQASLKVERDQVDKLKREVAEHTETNKSLTVQLEKNRVSLDSKIKEHDDKLAKMGQERTHLDTKAKSLDDRHKNLDEREKALASSEGKYAEKAERLRRAAEGV